MRYPVAYIISAILLSLSTPVRAQIPVILRVAVSEQADSTGCNFVRELTRVTYAAIMTGKVQLWNSPGKEIVVTSASLKEIERTSGLSFMDQDIVFIYEVWSDNGNVLNINTNGFLFSGKNQSGESVEFGYVESGSLQEFLIRETVNSNVNGNHNASLAGYLAGRKFNYNFIQFAGKIIDNPADSRKIIDEYVSGQEVKSAFDSGNDIPQKLVVYSIDFSSDISKEKSANANKILKAVEAYLQTNEELIYNLGGDSIIQNTPKGRWKVSRMVVTELWKKIGSAVQSDLAGVTVYFNNFALQEIPYRDIVNMDDLRIEGIALDEYLRNRNYTFVIRRINSEEIPRSDAYLFYKALFNAEWNKITEFVSKQK